MADAAQTAAVNGKINRFGRGSVHPPKAPSRSPNRCVTDARTRISRVCCGPTDGRTDHAGVTSLGATFWRRREEGNRLSSDGGPAAVPSREPLAAALVPAAFSFRGTDHRDHVGKAGS